VGPRVGLDYGEREKSLAPAENRSPVVQAIARRSTDRAELFPEITQEDKLYGWFQQDSAALHVCLCTYRPMPSGTELPAVEFGQYVHPILILVIFTFGVV
jgi:hypothetical protein